MTFSIRKIIQEYKAPNHRLSCSSSLWKNGLTELKRRSGDYRESGAFLLGTVDHHRRRIARFVFYDDLDPNCLDSGIVVFDGSGYGPLWELCRKEGLSVVADIHTHPGVALQSGTDKENPMVATKGHIAIIIPSFANRIIAPDELGIYEYLGAYQWNVYSGSKAKEFFYIGTWG